MTARSPGRWLRHLAVVHAALGIVVYRRELQTIARRGFVGAVPYRSQEAAALWFVGTALPGWLVGRLADVAADAGEYDSLAVAGKLGLAAAAAGTVLMPISPFWLQALVCGEMIREARRARSAGDHPRVHVLAA